MVHLRASSRSPAGRTRSLTCSRISCCDACAAIRPCRRPLLSGASSSMASMRNASARTRPCSRLRTAASARQGHPCCQVWELLPRRLLPAFTEEKVLRNSSIRVLHGASCRCALGNARAYAECWICTPAYLAKMWRRTGVDYPRCRSARWPSQERRCCGPQVQRSCLVLAKPE